MSKTLQQVGNYLLEREIGRGATSEVWIGHHAYLERRVAVKLLMTQDEETVQRFNREATLLSSLHHPNIVPIYDHGYHAPFFYSVLEYIHGCSLQKLLDRVHRLDFTDALDIFRYIAAALDYAHSRGIIHRDVSPGNVLVENETGQAFLTDFGIARDLSHTMTVDSRVMGTPGYWSPEHARSATEVTHLSDIYGLGVVLYVMLSGDLPWDTVSPLPGATFEPPVPLKQRGVNSLPRDIDRVIQIMLALNPNKRYPSARSAVEELERIWTRHHAVTQVFHRETASPSDSNPLPGHVPEHQSQNQSQHRYPEEGLQATGIEPNEVEMVLGSDLVRSPITQAHERARTLARPPEIAHLLDAWAGRGFRKGFFRLHQPGRLARVHTVGSRNLYFYTMRVLYEQRGQPQIIEEPDLQAQTFPLEPEQDHWHVPLPPVQGFGNEPGGQVLVPGSLRIVNCQTCDGKGKILCKRCKGQGRVWTKRTVPAVPHGEGEGNEGRDPKDNASSEKRSRGTRQPTTRPVRSNQRHSRLPAARSVRSSKQANPAADTSTGVGTDAETDGSPRTLTEKVLVPCPECSGRGGLPCNHCAATGRMVQRKAFRWQRTTHTLEDHDDLSGIDQRWLRRTCQAQEIYRERVLSSPQTKHQPFHPEWAEVPRLKALMERASAATDDQSQARLVLSEVTISMIPLTDVTFDLGNIERDGLYRVTIFGFENVIPADWRLLDWERVAFFWGGLFLLALTAISIGFALFY
ncbi:MAG: protein kinase [Chloroflexaceae bacterium]|nr:protein kinase [Chloroflexaceae bacterium]